MRRGRLRRRIRRAMRKRRGKLKSMNRNFSIML